MSAIELVDKKKTLESVDVSVIISTKNRIELLKRALSSINSQTKKPFEIVIVNNGMPFSHKDETEIYLACENVKNIQIIDGSELQDISTCRSLGLSKASSSYITYLDDDNIMWPTWLGNAFDFMSGRNLNFIYGIQLREDVKSKYFFYKYSKEQLEKDNFIDTNAIMHKAEVGRWSPGVSRLSDWSFVLNYLSDYPSVPITPVEIVSTIYKTDAPKRISSWLYLPYKVLIGLLHNLIPESLQILEKKYKYCVICREARMLMPGPNGRANATCGKCESLERHRALFIMNEVIAGHLQKNNVSGKVIEVAPSKVSKSVFAYFADLYQSFDSDPAADGRECDFVADICSMPLADNSVSLFVALHVLEHVTQDHLAMKEISRVLAPGGICILQVPLAEYPAVTQEELILEDEIRIKKYGQIDHVRLYGEDILERLHANDLKAVFFDIDEVVPDFLVDILGLNDGMRFILAESNNGRTSGDNLMSLLNEFRRDFEKLEIFCRIFETK